ncbi:MAG: 6-phosphofructokinase [Planctomycetota bacterium]|jgi:6-phosphofructokinase 1
MSRIRGKAVVAQSGGPTAVINSAVAGVVETALANESVFTGVYGAYNGILGVLTEELFDLGKEDPHQMALLRRSPSAALGSCRYKLKDLDTSREDYERILEVFKAHGIRFFFYSGGNDSMDTADKVALLAAEEGYEMIVVGVPKTVDNDLGFTDHCPGYGSVAKYTAVSAMESGRDTEALWTHDTVTVHEVMGRNAGWIAASAGLARRCEEDAPHLIYLPEVPVTPEKIVADVNECLKRHHRAFVICGEGVKSPDGTYLAEAGGKFGKDAFGHKQLGGAAEAIRAIIEDGCGVKARTQKPGTMQRSAMHCASATDVAEAYMAGAAAATAAMEGTTGKMVSLVRADGDGRYRCTTGLVDLAKVANAEKPVPREYINEEGNGVTEAFLAYARPLIAGDAEVEVGDDGLPLYVRFARHMVEKKTGREYDV